MKKILILGAGLSTISLIEYLLENSEQYNWEVTVADISLEMAQEKINNHKNGRAIKFDIFNEEQRENEIKDVDIVVSMLPASMHLFVAKCCLRLKKDMVTASYVSPEINELDQQAKDAGVILLNEVGVDPGIDHMSTMKVLDEIKKQGGKMTAFRSYTGGLVAPKYDNNPWSYKFTWNPRNVVLAGQGTAKIIVRGKYKYIPYDKLFSRISRINVLDYGEFEGYANRDSLKYRKTYGLENIPTMIRGTLRRPGFCKTWDILVQLGLTDDTYTLENSENMTYNDFVNTYLKYEPQVSAEEKVRRLFELSEDSFRMYKLRWLGLFNHKKIGLKNVTPAQILQKLLEEKWNLEEHDKDMIVMQHQFNYILDNQEKTIKSSIVFEGIDQKRTAMAITVGTPAAIATKLILTNKINLTGVHVPTLKEIYNPILEELEDVGIKFIEETE